MNHFKYKKQNILNETYGVNISKAVSPDMVFFFMLLFISCINANAQADEKFIISGSVFQVRLQQPVAGALISVRGNKDINNITDSSGSFEFALPAGKYIIQASSIGYKKKSISIIVEKNEHVNVFMESSVTTLSEVIVNSTDNTQKVRSSQAGLETIDRNTALTMPAILGEIDIIKVLQLRPGVKNSGEGSSGISVRGGGIDQNLFLLDGSTIYNPNHLFGFFSTFNIDAIKDVRLYKSGFPAEFRGRLSSIINVNTLKGTDSSLSVGGGIGLISSRLNLQGNLLRTNKKGQTLTFNIAGRRTYADIFIHAINKANKNDSTYDFIPEYYFYDINARLDYLISDKDLIYGSFYYGRDHAKFDLVNFASIFKWGNIAASIHWKHRYNNYFNSELSVHLSNYEYDLQSKFDRFEFKIGSGIKDYTLSQKFTYEGLIHHQVKFGFEAALNSFKISKFNLNSVRSDENFNKGEDIRSNDGGIYFSDDWEVNSKLSINTGARLTAFRNKKIYTGLEPGVSARYLLNNNVSIKAGYSRMKQYKHYITSSGASLPTDIWYPSTSKAKPEISDLISLSLSWNLDNKFFISHEIYYKWMRQLVDNKRGASLLVNVLESELIFGKGNSYGNEITFEKTSGKLRGWIGYTLAWTTRKFAEINNGKRFFPRFDRRHELSIVLSYPFSKRVSFSGSWTYYTGNIISVPASRYFGADVPGSLEDDANFFIAPVYSARSNYRMPDYHRLDLGLILKLHPKHGSADLTFSAYNAYSRLNVYFVSFEASANNSEGSPSGYAPKAITLFPIIPSVTYNFKF